MLFQTKPEKDSFFSFDIRSKNMVVVVVAVVVVVVVIVVVAKRCFCINWSLFTGCAFLVERAKLKKTERFLTLNIVVLHPDRQRCPFFTCLHFQVFSHI